MKIDEEWINSLTRFETDLLKAYLDTGKGKIPVSIPEIDRALSVKECVHCKSEKIIRYGKSSKGRQRYLCKDCHKTFTIVTKSFFKNTRITYDQWLKLFECEMSGLTLKETSYQVSLSVTSCFCLRHKIYEVMGEAQAERLEGDVQLDTTFTEIGFKGLKKTPRPVKGSKKNPKANILFDKDPKICISTAADSEGNVFFRISGYGGESSDKYQRDIALYDKKCKIISDGSAAVKRFIKTNRFRSATLTEGYHKTKDGKHISDVNSLHSELKELIRKKRGISLRHLQGYLNKIVFRRKFIVHMKRSLWDLISYGFMKDREKKLINREISKKPFPVSLSDIYERYHYGMYALAS